ncbi:MAG TPA: hypothetical protein VMV45_00365 [Casimicrobiaceae bacterium]|nr:hypothetical protein [Casimicrobiaceae bacterium]
MSIALHGNTAESSNNVHPLPRRDGPKFARIAGALCALVVGVGLLLAAATHVPASTADKGVPTTESTAAAVDTDIHAPDMPASPAPSGYLPGRYTLQAEEPGEPAPTF